MIDMAVRNGAILWFGSIIAFFLYREIAKILRSTEPYYAPVELTVHDIDGVQLGVEIPPYMLERMGLKLGDHVVIELGSEYVTIRPVGSES